MTSKPTYTIYENKDGNRVPSVTTCLGILAKPALIHWAWEQGVAGLDYRKVRDASAQTGRLVHYLILCDLRGKQPNLSDYSENEIKAAETPMGKYLEWKSNHKIEPILLETPLVSNQGQFGGTPDFVGLIDGQLVLGDFKTSGAIYLENLCQLAAYEKLVLEQRLPGLIVDSFDKVCVFRFSKDREEAFEVQIIPDRTRYWDIFEHAYAIYQLSKGNMI